MKVGLFIDTWYPHGGRGDQSGGQLRPPIGAVLRGDGVLSRGQRF